MLADEEGSALLMKPLSKIRHSGFTLVELMLGVLVLGILAAIAAPNFRVWIMNSQIRNAAESALIGLQRARAEAVSRNTNVALVFGVGSSWNINVIGGANNPIDSRGLQEGGVNVTRMTLPMGATTITFNNLGGVSANADGTAALAQIDFDSSVLPPADSQELRVVIGLGGNARMCDPNASPSSPRKC